MIPSPPKAAKRHFRVEGLDGIDAFWWPKALKMRILAIKILRHFGEIPVTTSIWRALFQKPRELPEGGELGCSFSLGMGGAYLIVNTRGKTKRA